MRGQELELLTPARLVVTETNGRVCVEPQGDWVIDTVGAVEDELRALASRADPSAIVYSFTQLGRIDTAGAYLLGRLTQDCADPDGDFHYLDHHPVAPGLIAEVRRRTLSCAPVKAQTYGFRAAVARLGAGIEAAYLEGLGTLGFLGHTLTTAASTALRPWRFRLTPTVWVMEEAGVNAMPIIAVLSFFIGAVIAFMGANLLQTLGMTVFTVDLVAVTVLREFGVLITAIMLAGRSDSAFTASIGSMKMQQEIDAMKVLGIDPFEAIVLPRVIACTLMAPLLTFGGMVAGIAGGMVVAWSTDLQISPTMFITRMHENTDWSHFMVGMSKAPVFGLVIAIIGCRQGMEVGGDVESLGRRTTASVVQSIFAVIVIDAIFAMMYLELGI